MEQQVCAVTIKLVLLLSAGVFALLICRAKYQPVSDTDLRLVAVSALIRPGSFESLTAHQQAAVFRALCESGARLDPSKPLGLFPGFPSRKPFTECKR
jgi:hypothetical protein